MVHDFYDIKGAESYESQLSRVEPGMTVIYCSKDSFAWVNATVVSKNVVEKQGFFSKLLRSNPQIDLEKSYITVVPYGCYPVYREESLFKLGARQFIIIDEQETLGIILRDLRRDGMMVSILKD